jgi:hypothetical protein
MSTRTCAADGCTTRFEPYSIDQVYCSHRCGTRMRVRLHRQRKCGGGDGGGGKRQRSLFPKPLPKSKPPKPVPVAEPTLFGLDLIATHGGTLRYGADGSVTDNDPFQVLRKAGRKPSAGVESPLTGLPNAA